MLFDSALYLVSLFALAPTPVFVQHRVELAVPLLVKSSLGHIEKQTCFGCHNQTFPVLAVVTARERGLSVQGDVKEQTSFIADFLGRNKDKFTKGEGTGGSADTAGYALFTLDLGGYLADDITTAVVEYLLQYQSNQDHWRSSSDRPPSETSHFTTNYFALRALRVYGPAVRKEAIEKRVAAVRGWLLKTQAKDTEDRVFRLLALKETQASADEIKSAAEQLRKTQRIDGGWAQLDSGISDAYATGTALVALQQTANEPSTSKLYQRGLAFLLTMQANDGTWLVKSRSKPFQPYYETGFPYGKDQFISSTASGWATAALALSLPISDKPPARLLSR